MIKTVTYDLDLGPNAQGKITATPLEDEKIKLEVEAEGIWENGDLSEVTETIEVAPKVLEVFIKNFLKITREGEGKTSSADG